jgi:cobalt-zinc-cadmium efflux system outer membrane protein
MSFKTTHNKLFYLILIAMTVNISGCQSIPNITDKAGVLRKVINNDQQLSKNRAIDVEQVAIKLYENAILTESDAVLYALNNNAAFNSLLIDLKLAKADLVNAGLLPNPEVLFAFGMTNKPYRYAIDFPIELLWLRPIRLSSMKHEADATTYRLTQAGINLIRDVRISYAQAVLSQEQLGVAEAAYKLRNNIYNLSLKRLEAGDINTKDLILIENDAARAKRDWELAQYEVKIKLKNLLYLLGVEQKIDSISLSPNFLPACNVEEVEQLLSQSLEHRPDILSAQYLINSAKEKVELSKRDWLKFNGSADATSGQVNGHTLGPAIRSTIPIANQNQGYIDRAQALLEKAKLELETLKQKAALEIRTTHLQYQQSCHDWNTLQNRIMPSVLQMINLTEQAYREGDISYLQTLEANRQILDTQMREVQLKADLISRLSELMRSSAIENDTQ